MKHLVLILLFGVWMSSSAFSQRKSCPQIICYPDHGLVLYPHKRQVNNVTTVKLMGDTIVKATVFDCEGKSRLIFYKGETMLFEQNYANGIVSDETLQMFNKTLGGYIDYARPNVLPIKDGVSTYYDLSGKIIRQEIWRSGKLVTSS